MNDTMPTQQRNQAIHQVTLWSVVLNLGLSLLKITAGWFGRSHAVVADGVHSLTDLASDLVILTGVKFWSEPADHSHPYGHGRLETLISLGLGATLGMVSAVMLGQGLLSLRHPPTSTPGWFALVAALVSLLLKEWLFRWTRWHARRWNSSALYANAWHHRSDAWSSVPVALAVIGVRLNPAWGFLDPVGAIVVSMFVARAAVAIVWPSFQQLIDHGAPPEAVAQIDQLVRETAGVQCVHKVRTRSVGSGWNADLHVLVDGDLTVRQGHAIAEVVQQRLLENGPDLVDVVVHIEPDDVDQRR